MRSKSSGLIAAALLVLASAAPPADAAQPADVAQPANAAQAPALASASPLAGLPMWHPPAEYSESLVMKNGDQQMTMRRFYKNDQIRTEMALQDEQLVMIEKGGESYQIMPSHKMMMKMPAPATPGAQAVDSSGPPPDVKIESLGPDKLNGRDALKYRVTSQGQTGLAWFDSGSGAPLRMETNGASIEWANFAAGKQTDDLFELPRDYQVIDMAALQKMAGGMGATGMMGGMPSMPSGAVSGAGGGVAIGGGVPGGGLSGLAGGVPGMGGAGGAGGGVSGIAQQMGSHFGQSMGEKFGASMGAQFGPLGSMAGSYIGGRIGGWLGAHAAKMVTGGGSH